ncbi:MAG TPA: hypothetical protein VFA91_02465 [Candidatus Polarisedimenticolia bacterium]|nr:hypothetical protein [Candidatus Polarisedimenticolia bacterium]
MSDKRKDADKTLSLRERQSLLSRLNRFTQVSAPAVTLLLAAETKPMLAAVKSDNSCAAMIDPFKKPKFA